MSNFKYTGTIDLVKATDDHWLDSYGDDCQDVWVDMVSKAVSLATKTAITFEVSLTVEGLWGKAVISTSRKLTKTEVHAVNTAVILSREILNKRL